MAVTVGSISVAEAAGKKLDTAVVVTTDGSVHREGVFAADPEDAAARGNIRNTTPGGADYGAVTRPIVAALPLPAGASTEATLATRLDAADFDTKAGSLTEAAPATDTASSGLNGRLQRIAQRLSSLIALIPAALVGGRFDTNLGSWLGSTAPTVGSKTSANSVPVVVASDQGAVAVSSAGLTNLDVALSTRLKPADTLAAVTAITNVVHVDDNAGSLTVDAPVGTPVFVRLSDGAAAQVGQKVMASSLPVVLASDQTGIPVNGDVDHDAVNTLKNIQAAGNANPVDVPPTAVSANGDRVRLWADRYGSPVVRSRRIRESYTAVFRLAETAARLDQAFTQVANTNKQWATLHHLVGATKEVRLMKCLLYITSDTVAGIQGVVELRQISAAPATGNPAITPTPHRRGAAAAEAVALYLPTTAGTEAGVNSPLAHVPFDTGISGAVSTANPVPVLIPVVLYDASQEDPEVLPPTLPVATLDGWAVMVRTVGVPVLRATVVMTFTEEIP